MILSLPFLYRVGIRIGRQRKPRNHMVRGYTLVEVPEISEAEMVEAIKVEYSPHTRGYENEPIMVSIGHYGDRLFRTVTEYGVPIDGATLEARLAEAKIDAAHIDRMRWSHRHTPAFDHFEFPTPNIRNGTEPHLDPFRFPTYAELSAKSNFANHPPDSSDVDARSTAAAVHLSEAVVLVDGAVWVEHAEPVWARVHRSDRYEVEMTPDRDYARQSYRLDVAHVANAYSFTRRISTLTFLRPDILRRDDVRELAREALSLWPEFRKRIEWAAHDGKELKAEVDRIHAHGQAPTLVDCISVLDAFDLARRVMTANGHRFWDRGHSIPQRAGAIVTRWRRERETFLGRLADGAFPPGDREALEDIHREIW